MRGLKIAGKIISKVIVVLLALLLAINLYTVVMRQAFGRKQPSVFGFFLCGCYFRQYGASYSWW